MVCIVFEGIWRYKFILNAHNLFINNKTTGQNRRSVTVVFIDFQDIIARFIPTHDIVWNRQIEMNKLNIRRL